MRWIYSHWNTNISCESHQHSVFTILTTLGIAHVLVTVTLTRYRSPNLPSESDHCYLMPTLGKRWKMVKQCSFAFILFDFEHWGSLLRLHQHYFKCMSLLSICSLTGRVMCHELWTSQGDSLAFHPRSPRQTWSVKYLAENIVINSSKLQSSILLHKRIHIYGHYNFLAATKQLYDWFSPSVCPSVRLSVTPFSPCSHHRIMKFSGVITMDRSDVHAKFTYGMKSCTQLEAA